MKTVSPYGAIACLPWTLALQSILGCGLFCGSAANAELLIESTRIVYPQARREVSFRIQNLSAEKPALVQLWVDEAESDAGPENSVAPFILSPPLVRLSANGRQTVRLMYTGESPNLAQEELYTLNLLEPPQAVKGSDDADRVNFIMRLRLKIFFRPRGLKGNLEESMRQLQCKLVDMEGTPTLDCYNQSPFHLSFLGYKLGNAREKGPDSNFGMFPPRTRASFALKDVDKLPRPLNTVAFNFINDIGATVPVEFALAVH
jgi:chaperone protein EcpD